MGAWRARCGFGCRCKRGPTGWVCKHGVWLYRKSAAKPVVKPITKPPTTKPAKKPTTKLCKNCNYSVLDGHGDYHCQVLGIVIFKDLYDTPNTCSKYRKRRKAK